MKTCSPLPGVRDDKSKRTTHVFRIHDAESFLANHVIPFVVVPANYICGIKNRNSNHLPHMLTSKTEGSIKNINDTFETMWANRGYGVTLSFMKRMECAMGHVLNSVFLIRTLKQIKLLPGKPFQNPPENLPWNAYGSNFPPKTLSHSGCFM